MTKTRWAALWRLGGALGVALTLVLSLAPMPDTGIDVVQGDKLMHFVGYGTLMAWHVPLARSRRALVIYGLAFVLLGGAIEMLQTLVPWRFGNDPWDALSNTAGVLLGTVVAIRWRGRLAT